MSDSASRKDHEQDPDRWRLDRQQRKWVEIITFWVIRIAIREFFWAIKVAIEEFFSWKN